MSTGKICSNRTGKCPFAGRIQPLSEFHKSAKGKLGVSSECKSCNKIYKNIPENKERAVAAEKTRREKDEGNWKRKRADASRKYSWKKRGIRKADGSNFTPVDRDAALIKQNYRCAICGTVEPGKLGWCADHDSVTGTFRWMLCNDCNLALGFAKDNPALLRKMANMLELFFTTCSKD